ncbi:MAG: hypothetical protein WBC13_01395 [Dokdonella sp.]
MTTLKELIAAHASDLGDSYDEIAKRLNEQPEIDNPVTEAPAVPRPLSLEDVFGVIAGLANAETEMPKLAKLPTWAYDGAVRAMNERNSTSITNWLVTVAKICGFEAATVQAMATAQAALMAATIDDPTYSATIAGQSLAQAAGLGTITAAAVQAALNA